jgi:large subunit ribosomal protein L13
MNKTKASQITHEKHEINAEGRVLGRLATEIALLLVGKHKPYFVRHLDCGDFVRVLNAEKIKVTGKKEQTKTYTRFSGYPGGLKTIPFKQMKKTEIISRAVWGMLPKTKWRDVWMSRLSYG